MTIGDKLKHEREFKKLTQRQLAELVSVSQSMIVQLERGTKTLTVPLAVVIAKALKIDINLLISER